MTPTRFQPLSPITASKRPEGFTIIEMLVSTVILAVLVGLLLSILNAGTAMWTRGTSKIQAFQEARAAYEAMTRKISQATLNIYWGYDTTSAGEPTGYRRKSELQFVSGPAATVLGAPALRTHAIFFQSPLGYTTNASLRPLQSLLVAAGYLLEFGTDSSERPGFLGGSTTERWRFRLRELWQPSERLTIYGGTPNATLPASWYSTNSTARLAENVIALVIRPRLPQTEDTSGNALLSSGFLYNSAASNTYTATGAGGEVSTGNTLNQLPPVVQVIMVCIDEKSAARVANGSTIPDFGISDWSNLFVDPDKLTDDLRTLEAALTAKSMTYQIFDSLVPIEGAKWSR